MGGRVGELLRPFVVCRAVWPMGRGGLCGCERTGQHLPWHDKARTLRAGRAGPMLQEIPYRFLLNLSNHLQEFFGAGSAGTLVLALR